MPESRWRHFDNPSKEPTLELLVTLSQQIRELEGRDANILPDLRSGSTILVASDYSGQHTGADYQVISLLLADLDQCAAWEALRRKVRQDFLRDGRRMSFKGLGDRQKGRALLPFLNAANSIPGLTVSFAIHKEIDSLFVERNWLRSDEPDFRVFYSDPRKLDRLIC